MRARTRYTKTLFDSGMLATKGAIGLKSPGTGIDQKFDSQIMGGINPTRNPFEGIDY